MQLSDAISEHVRDGMTVALEGFTHLIPFAAGHEVLRQGRRELELIRMTPDLLYDQMLGVGAARKLVFSYGGNPGVGSLHRFRDAIEHGWPRPVELEEHSHAGMANRYVAGASGMPCARRSVIRWSIAAITWGTHLPRGLSAVFHACDSVFFVDTSDSDAATTSPALLRQRDTPVYAANTTGRTTPSASASR